MSKARIKNNPDRISASRKLPNSWGRRPDGSGEPSRNGAFATRITGGC